VNTATGSENASIVDPNAANNTATATVTVASTTVTPSSTVAGLTIVASADTLKPQPGATVHYTLAVSALGPATSTGVAATDILPSGVTFVSATPSVGTYSSSTGAWAIGELAPSSAATLKITAMVNSSDVVGRTITNTAMATEDPSLVNPVSAQATASAAFTVAFPMPIVPATLSIGAAGNFLSRGMVVTSVQSSSFQAQVWGNTYTVNFVGNGDNDGDEFLLRNSDTPFNFDQSGGHLSDQVIVGDVVNVSGRVTTAAPFVVMANVVRNDSIISPREPRPIFSFGGDGSGVFSGFGSGTSSNSGTDSSGSSNGTSSGSDASSLATQLNSLAAQLQQIEQMFQGQQSRNR
jgi:uncharacterized repeat protein (TIGR01451 family)